MLITSFFFFFFFWGVEFERGHMCRFSPAHPIRSSCDLFLKKDYKIRYRYLNKHVHELGSVL